MIPPQSIWLCRSIAALAWLVCGLGVPVAKAQGAPAPAVFADADAAQRWMMTYFIDKDVSAVPAFLQVLAAEPDTAKTQGAVAAEAAFLSVVFADNTSRVDVWLKAQSFSGPAREVIDQGLWFAGMTERLRRFDPPALDRFKTWPVLLSQINMAQAADQDRLWGAFFASGKTDDLTLLVDMLDPARPFSPDAQKALALRYAAAWSLAANMRSNLRVLRFVEAEAKARTGEVKRTLDGILAKYRADLPKLPHQAGEFGALMVVLDRAGLDEFSKPSAQGLKLTQRLQAKVGEERSIKLIFTGQALGTDLQCDVSYDLKVTGPDGAIYSQTDVKNLLALKQRLATNDSLYDNAAVVTLRFEAKDAPGVYTIDAVLHDNISGKALPLQARVRLDK